MIVLGPDTTSPPAKMPARPVASVRESATMPAQPLTSIPAPAGRIDGSGSSPTATRIVAAGRSRSRAGDRHPMALGSHRPARRGPLGSSMQRMAMTAPSRLDDLDRSQAGLDDDPLALGCFDLLDLRRHLRATSSIDDRDRRGAAAPGGPCGVHGCASATDDDGRPGQSRFLVEVDLLQEEGGRHDSRARRPPEPRAADSSTRRWPGRSPDSHPPRASPRSKSRPIAVSSLRSTPRPTIRAISAWRTSRGSR